MRGKAGVYWFLLATYPDSPVDRAHPAYCHPLTSFGDYCVFSGFLRLGFLHEFMFRIGIFYKNLWFELGFLRSGLFCLGKVRGALVFFVECLMSGFHKKNSWKPFHGNFQLSLWGQSYIKLLTRRLKCGLVSWII